MTAPHPNVTLADGRKVYLPPASVTWLEMLNDNGPWVTGDYPDLRRLANLGLATGVRPRGAPSWHWEITQAGKDVLSALRS